MNDLKNLKDQASRSEAQRIKLFGKLKKKRPSDLDEVFHRSHAEAFDDTDCLACANCCKTTSPIFRPGDIDRLSATLKISPGQFIQKYLHIDEDRDYVLNSSPCPFLDNENYCIVYKDRPTACKEYPHTNRKKMYQLLDLTLKNSFICPAVLKITEKLRSLY